MTYDHWKTRSPDDERWEEWPPEQWFVCDACHGAGFGHDKMPCDNCGGEGGWLANAEDVEDVAARSAP